MTKWYLSKWFTCMFIACSLAIITPIVFSTTPLPSFFIGATLGVSATIAAIIWDEYA